MEREAFSNVIEMRQVQKSISQKCNQLFSNIIRYLMSLYLFTSLSIWKMLTFFFNHTFCLMLTKQLLYQQVSYLYSRQEKRMVKTFSLCEFVFWFRTKCSLQDIFPFICYFPTPNQYWPEKMALKKTVDSVCTPVLDQWENRSSPQSRLAEASQLAAEKR